MQVSRIQFLFTFVVALTIALFLHNPVGAVQLNPTVLVDIRSINPRIALDIRYATTNNFVKQKLYPEARCILRAAAAQQLSQVQTALEAQGLGLKVYDCYRPLAIQRALWAIKPDDRFVANPAYGSRHNRGMAVDLTLVDRAGNELAMPTGFDDFSDRASRSYKNLPANVLKNRQTLEDAMVKAGFIPLATEWWHFDTKGWQNYAIRDIPFSAIPSTALNNSTAK
ncbi:M15 family metallopeptidase [Leptolyngbya boryana CZ1]|uniref:D-alanyl-D-alanine dipeptidase n=1 Tax=Leptolyngbya boryana CZ1 TaxID=3060204 RepID=A0AA97ALR5_LEPBY|nr:M15 family metallopeptidase [Leptolyngbya boryana]WNZ43537.1 M15 family metallopeptidase [Leptolyngbya boryana CZ1]